MGAKADFGFEEQQVSEKTNLDVYCFNFSEAGV